MSGHITVKTFHTIVSQVNVYYKYHFHYQEELTVVMVTNNIQHVHKSDSHLAYKCSIFSFWILKTGFKYTPHFWLIIVGLVQILLHIFDVRMSKNML